MLPDKNRLKGSLVFDEVKKQGKMYQSDTFGILVRKREDDEPTRFGIVVSNKISKKAVERNKVKRMLRKVIRKKLGKIKDGFDVVVLANKGLLKAEADDLEEELTKKLKEGKLI